ncbi:MAG: hypothetical protein INR67_19145 [Jatrophihabitans endophyticus]|nr:hypothetical protein [Jatrophihabitans endophyticus]
MLLLDPPVYEPEESHSGVDHAPPARPGRFDLSTTSMRVVLKDPTARAIFDELVPEIPKHPMIRLAKGMPVATVLGLAANDLPADRLDELRRRLEAL